MAEFQRLLEAATKGKAEETENGKTWRLDDVNQGVLCDRRTEKGNTCLHIASLCGHKPFCTQILAQEPRAASVSSLLSVKNLDGETPLLVAVKNGHVSVAEYLLEEYSSHGLNQCLLEKDEHAGNNVLHHAIRNGYEDLALKLIAKQPALSESCNQRHESPMFMAVLKGFDKVYDKLLSIENSLYTGACGYNALHAAVKYGNKDFVQKLVNKSPEWARNLAKQEDDQDETPMHLAAHFNRDEILQVMLKCDRSLGYIISNEKGIPLLYIAAWRGHVTFARALLEHCPDAPYCNNDGRTCLHEAVEQDRIKFVEFIVEKNSKLGKLVNLLDRDGCSALDMAVNKCNPKMVSALLGHRGIDATVINKHACTAIWRLNDKESENLSKTINCVRMLSTNL